MLSTSDVAKVFDTVLSIPGMNGSIKINVKISRKYALLLNSVIKRGLNKLEDNKLPNFLESIPADTLEELNSLADEFLVKAGLTELSEKLSLLGTTK